MILSKLDAFPSTFFTNYLWNFREFGAFELTYKGIKDNMETSAPVNIIIFHEHQFYRKHFLIFISKELVVQKIKICSLIMYRIAVNVAISNYTMMYRSRMVVRKQLFPKRIEN